jgi:hypothetical protein
MKCRGESKRALPLLFSFHIVPRILNLSTHTSPIIACQNRYRWDTLRRFSEFEALLQFLTESPKAGTCGPKLKQLVSSTPKSIRFITRFVVVVVSIQVMISW